MLDHPITDKSLENHIAVMGTTGGGKSYSARRIIEDQLTAKRRVCIIDSEGIWWGLKANSAGDGPGFPVAVVGGEHGDMPLTEGMGEALAEIVAANNLPMVIDTELLPSDAARTRFLIAFLGALRRKNTLALTLVLEEADAMAPQQPMPETTRLLHEVKELAKRGRKRGFKLLMISQRPAAMHKDVLTQIQTMVIHRFTAPQDKKAIAGWVQSNADVEAGKAVIDSLSKLKTGEAWIWNPPGNQLDRVMMPRIATFDSSGTPSFSEGRRIEPVGLAEVDLTALKAALDVPKPDPKTEPKASPAASDAARKAGYDAGLLQGRTEGHALGLEEGLRRGRQAIVDRVMAALGEAPVVERHAPVVPKVVAPPRQAPEGLPAAAIRMLEVLDTNPPIRMSWNALAASVGNKARGGHFNTVRKALTGLVIEEGGLVRHANPSSTSAPPMDARELAAYLRTSWRTILGGRPAQIIDALTDHPKTKAAVAESLGCAPTGGHWNSAWKALRDNDLITESGGVVSLAGELQG